MFLHWIKIGQRTLSSKNNESLSTRSCMKTDALYLPGNVDIGSPFPQYYQSVRNACPIRKVEVSAETLIETGMIYLCQHKNAVLYINHSPRALVLSIVRKGKTFPGDPPVGSIKSGIPTHIILRPTMYTRWFWRRD